MGIESLVSRNRFVVLIHVGIGRVLDEEGTIGETTQKVQEAALRDK